MGSSGINKVQTQFLTKLLNVPCTTPKCALLKETGQIKATHTANLRKLEFYIDLHNREETRLEVQMRIHQEKKAQKDMTYEKGNWRHSGISQHKEHCAALVDWDNPTVLK